MVEHFVVLWRLRQVKSPNEFKRTILIRQDDNHVYPQLVRSAPLSLAVIVVLSWTPACFLTWWSRLGSKCHRWTLPDTRVVAAHSQAFCMCFVAWASVANTRIQLKGCHYLILPKRRRIKAGCSFAVPGWTQSSLQDIQQSHVHSTPAR